MIQYPHAKCLTTANVWRISKKSTHFSRVYLSPLGCISPTALWHSPTWLLSCCFCSMTKSLLPQLYPWIWITNTVCTYIYEIQLILPPHMRWEEACQSDWVVSCTLGNLGCGATAEKKNHISRGDTPLSDKHSKEKHHRLWNKSNYLTGADIRIN